VATLFGKLQVFSDVNSRYISTDLLSPLRSFSRIFIGVHVVLSPFFFLSLSLSRFRDSGSAEQQNLPEGLFSL
jgi:hypothetical protein